MSGQPHSWARQEGTQLSRGSNCKLKRFVIDTISIGIAERLPSPVYS
jgi:hypothetical protein